MIHFATLLVFSVLSSPCPEPQDSVPPVSARVERIIRRIDLAEAYRNQRMTVATSTIDMGSASVLFDRDPATLIRSKDINPLFVQLGFSKPVNVGGFEVLAGQPGYAQVDEDEWWVEAADNAEDLESRSGSYWVMNSAEYVAGTLGRSFLHEPVTKRVFRFWIQRILSPEGHGNYVHLWEIALLMP